MRAAALRRCLMAWVCLATPPTAWATHPIQAFQYAFRPDHGELRITGGFAGFDLAYQLQGSFQLMLDPFPHHPDEVQAKFFEVDATLRGPEPFDGASLDDLLNLSGGKGKIDGPALIHFVGEDSQGAPWQIDAMHLDIGLKLDGSNKPPCCDFFHYELHDLIAVQIFSPQPSADFDGDYDVDRDDLRIWIRVMNQGRPSPRADADGDHDTDGSDWLLWQQQFGQRVLNFAPVPEPASILTALIGVAGVLVRRRRMRT